MNGNFAAQLTDGSQFSRVKTDKAIEMTLYKDAKTPGRCTGISRNMNAIKRWEINAAYRAALRTCFHKHLDYQLQKYKHPDLNPSRIYKKMKMMSNVFWPSLKLPSSIPFVHHS